MRSKLLVAAAAAATLLAGLGGTGVTGTARAAGDCPPGMVPYSLDPNSVDPPYFNDVFAETFASRDKNDNRVVCATFTPGFNNLRVTDDK
jgi:hypothetical protein